MPTTKPKPTINHQPATPIWEGPSTTGITYSLLCKYLVCKERFRLLVVEGLKEKEKWNHKIEYGSMFHEGLEAQCKGDDPYLAIQRYCDSQLKPNYPTQFEQIDKWGSICRHQFKHYQDYIDQIPEVRQYKYLLQEEPFRVPYILSSGRTVILRGKWDAVFLHPAQRRRNETSQPGSIYLQENKTKGQIDEEFLPGTLPWNLQTMFYLIAIDTYTRLMATEKLPCEWDQIKPKWERVPGPIVDCYDKTRDKTTLSGVLYNVIRRPLSDLHAIRQRKGRFDKKTNRRIGVETDKQFYQRVGDEIGKDPDHYFKRWKVLIRPADIETFKRECLHPILEGLCDWWKWISENPNDPYSNSYTSTIDGNKYSRCPHQSQHYRTPFGIYNPLGTGTRGDYYDLLTKGRKSSLQKVSTLFPELE